MPESQPPSLLTIVVVVVTGASHLRRCLQALLSQVSPPRMEILVPHAAYDAETPALQAEFPSVRFHCVKHMTAPRAGAGQRPHADLDVLRAEGIKHARGEIIALTEDHARVDGRWAMNMMRAHEAQCAAAGGAIENEVDRPLNWAVYFCDFGRYRNPVGPGPAETISDINISYKRTALQLVRDTWQGIYHEPRVNEALRVNGQSFLLSPEIILFQHREGLTLRHALQERYLWGRYYAANRIRSFSSARRFAYILFSVLLPILLVARMIHTVFARKRAIARFIRSFPLFVLLTCFWSFGEFAGYLTGKDAGGESSPDPEGGARSAGLSGMAANFTILSAAELLSKIVTFFAFTLLARVLGPSGFGSIEFTLALLIFSQILTEFGTGPYGAREIARNPGSAPALIGAVVALRFLLAAAAYALLCVFAFFMVHDPNLQLLILIYGLSLFATPGYLQWVFQGFDRMRLVAFGSLVRQLIFAILVLLLIRRPEQLVSVAWMECTAVASLAMCNVMMMKLYFGGARIRPRLSGIRNIFRQSLPIGLSELTWTSTWYFPTVLLGLLVGGSVVGWFGAALRPVMTLHAFVYLYFYNMLPSLSRCVDQPREALQKLMRRSLQLTAWPAVFLGVAGTALARPAMLLVFGSGYAESIRTFQILVWILPTLLLSGHYRYALIAFNHQRYEFQCSMYTAILSVGLGAWLIPRYGSDGAAVALLISATANWILAYLYVQQRIEKIPVLTHLVKPAFAGAAMYATFLLVQSRGVWVAGGASAATFAILMLLLQPGVRRMLA